MPASFLSTSLVERDVEGKDIREGGGRALAESLRLNTTLTSTSTGIICERGEGRRLQRHCDSTPPLRRSNLA
jgi:hypothetical protein